MNDRVLVKAVKLPGCEDLPSPEYKSRGASGLDLHASIMDKLELFPGETSLVPTGLKISLPLNLEGQVRPRSGLAVRHGITVLNSPGTIDSDYRGEIKVPLINLGGEVFSINRGMRIAQLVITPVVRIEFDFQNNLDNSTRNEGGFGHTGYY